MKKILPGAGVIVARMFDDEIKFLALQQFNTRTNPYSMGLYDIPKGVKEDDESFFECAVRECFEESNVILREENFLWGQRYIQLSKLVVFVAITNSECKIKKNPVSGIQEHECARWLTAKEFKEKIIPWLEPAIDWATDTIDGKNKCTSMLQRYN